MARVINVHGVKVPNPLAMKFEVSDLLLTPSAFTFASKEEAKRSPLAEMLFGFDYVSQVFIAKNFITVTKIDEMPSWDQVMIDVRIIIKKHLEAGLPVFDFDSTAMPELPENEPYLSEKIREMIETQIHPATWQDGGEIYFDSFEDGVVKVKMAGACVRCPFAPRTLKNGVEVLLMRHFPDVKSVTSDDVNWDETQQEETPLPPVDEAQKE